MAAKTVRLYREHIREAIALTGNDVPDCCPACGSGPTCDGGNPVLMEETLCPIRWLSSRSLPPHVSNDLYGDFSFYSEYRGKHQYLPNGNVLIVLPEEGRVVELTHDARKVLEFNNISPFGEEYNDDVENALWLEPGYFAQIPTCKR